MTVTTTRKARLRRIVKEEVIRALFREQGTPADQAKQLGLVKAPGFGNYAEPDTGTVTHQSRGGQLVPTKQGGGTPTGGQASKQPQAQPQAPAQRPPQADIPQNQPPAQGEPPQPAQRGGPETGGPPPPEMPQGPEMPENPVTKLMRKIVDVDKIKMATSTGDTDTIKTAIDQLAVAKEKIAQSREGQASVPGIEKLQLGLQKQFGNALKQKQALTSFGEKGEEGNVFDPAADRDYSDTYDSDPKHPDRVRNRKTKSKTKDKSGKPGSAYGDWNKALGGRS